MNEESNEIIETYEPICELQSTIRDNENDQDLSVALISFAERIQIQTARNKAQAWEEDDIAEFKDDLDKTSTIEKYQTLQPRKVDVFNTSQSIKSSSDKPFH